ncbi:MAG: radical SAM protein [Thermoleophilia bacterium]
MTPLVRLKSDCSIKLMEEPCLYNRRTDELYIVSGEAEAFLEECLSGATRPDTGDAASFVDYCLEEGLMELVRTPVDRFLPLRQSPVPSLRYLLLHITERCNLKCRHCFHGEAGSTDLPLERMRRVIDEFEAMQGLRLLISGGEPMLHSDFWELNKFVGERDIRPILMTNGMLIDEDSARRLKFQEVQISLDGMKEGHEYLRGPGTFDRAMKAIRALISAGVQVSVATMIHHRNLQDFHYLAGILHDLGIREWSVDLPSPVGRMAEYTDLLADPQTAGPLLDYAFGGAVHDPVPGYACGTHLMAVMANGDMARCGFYADQPVGDISEGLAQGWEKIDRVLLEQLECDCQHIEVCRGGCRFRAAGYNKPNGPDPCQCFRYGVLKS